MKCVIAFALGGVLALPACGVAASDPVPDRDPTLPEVQGPRQSTRRDEPPRGPEVPPTLVPPAPMPPASPPPPPKPTLPPPEHGP